MKYNRLFIASLAIGIIAATTILSACTITRKPDGTFIAEPSSGRPVKIPPARVSRVTINGKCYYKFEGQNGTVYCFPCDLEGEGYAEPCDSLIRSDSSGSSSSSSSGVSPGISPGTSPGTRFSGAGGAVVPWSVPSPEQRAFLSLLSEWMQQEDIPLTHDAIWLHFGLGQWVDGETTSVPTVLAKLDDAGDGFLKIMMITRTDWQYPDISNGATLEYYFLRDASDDVPDAMVLQLSGSFQQVADSMKAFFNGVFTYETSYDGHSIMIIGDQNLVSVIVDGATLWEG